MSVITCLLPIRNGLEFLPDFVDYNARFFDKLVVLDDGCTDGSIPYLMEKVKDIEVIQNPQRASYQEWDDCQNRNNLLEFLDHRNEQGWAIFLDADELLDIEDGAKLRSEILRGNLDTQKAYGFPLYRMIGDLHHFTKGPLSVFRMFYFQAGHRIVAPKLHFEPIPQQIPQENWQLTEYRIKHLASLTSKHQAMRFKKYQEADPNCKYQDSYANLLEKPVNITKW